MATEFVKATSTTRLDQDTPDVAFVRWASGPGGCRYEFGTITNFEHVLIRLRAGERFEPLDGIAIPTDPASAQDLEQLVRDGLASFGEFPVTVALGSGNAWRFTVEE